MNATECPSKPTPLADEAQEIYNDLWNDCKEIREIMEEYGLSWSDVARSLEEHGPHSGMDLDKPNRCRVRRRQKWRSIDD
jgi:hypothetical protein